MNPTTHDHHDNSSNNDATKDNPGDDDDENPSPNIIELDSKQLKRNNYTTRIRLWYDAIRDMNLKGNTRESDKKKPDGYSNIVNVGYEVSLSPFGGRLDSPFETSPGNSESSDTKGCRKAEPRQESNFPIRSDDESRETGIIAIFIEEKDHTESIIRADFNGMRASVVIDTCSATSTIEFNDPMQNRIFKVGKRIKYSRVHKEKDASINSKKIDDKETASVERETSHSRSDKAIQEQ